MLAAGTDLKFNPVQAGLNYQPVPIAPMVQYRAPVNAMQLIEEVIKRRGMLV
jgi:hypothetical protein